MMPIGFRDDTCSDTSRKCHAKCHHFVDVWGQSQPKCHCKCHARGSADVCTGYYGYGFLLRR
jgi:hypothetical protein